MKRLLPLLICITALSSCTAEIDQLYTGARKTLDKPPMFYATAESSSVPDTKTFADSQMRVLWNAGDQISIFNKITYNQGFEFDGDDGDTAGGFYPFTQMPMFGSWEDLDCIYAVYPYSTSNKCGYDGDLTVMLPAEQSYKESSFGIGANTMVAVTEGSRLRFKNVGGYLSLRLYGDNVKVSSVSIQGNNGEKIAGKATVTIPLDGTPTTVMDNSATDAITIVCDPAVQLGADAEHYTDFWFVIPPVTFTNGFTITVTDDLGGVFERRTSSSLTINRNQLDWMNPLKVTFNTVEVTSIELEQTPAALRVGETIMLNAIVKPDNATNKTVEWISSDESIATIDSKGNITAIKKGVVTITAKAGQRTCNSVVLVMSSSMDQKEEYLTFMAADESYIKFDGIGLEYSTDTNNWVTWPQDYEMSLSAGDMIYMRGDNSFEGRFVILGRVYSSGNIMSLIYKDDFKDKRVISKSQCFSCLFMFSSGLLSAPVFPAISLSSHCYGSLFAYCTNLLEAPELPATALEESCYAGMFYGCTSLEEPPVLPATLIAGNCYGGMFSGCTSLTKAPALPATILDYNCYHDMFAGCTSLTEAPVLPATAISQGCYGSMFEGCTSLRGAPALPATILDIGCYCSMFKGCISLETAPSLPATSLPSDTYGCYEEMFSGCVSLREAPVLPATILGQSCYKSMFAYCTNLTKAPDLPATKLEWDCYENMFGGCTSLKEAPTLLATALSANCYQDMFSGCSSMEEAPALPATTLESSCYCRMFKGCTSLRIAPDLPATNLASWCYQSMFEGCSCLTKAPDLPAISLVNQGFDCYDCYKRMFYYCSALEYVKMMAVSIPDMSYINGMLQFVSSSGTFVKNAAATWEENGVVPSGWIVETALE